LPESSLTVNHLALLAPTPVGRELAAKAGVGSPPDRDWET